MGGGEGMDHNFTEMLQDMLPKKKKRRTVTVAEAEASPPSPLTEIV